MSCIFPENLVSRHFSDGLCNARSHQVDDLASPYYIDERYNHEPDQEAAAADDECVFEADDVAESEHGRPCVELEHELRLVGDCLSEGYDCGGQGLSPCSEGGYDEVVQSADEAAQDEGLRAVSAAFAANEHLRGRRCFRERIFPVHLLHEIFAERNQEQYAEHAAEQGREEHLHEIHFHS